MFSIAGNGRMVPDEMVCDPRPGSGHIKRVETRPTTIPIRWTKLKLMKETDITRLFDPLVATRAGYSQRPQLSGPGLYAMFLRTGCEPPGVALASTRVVYLGISSDLATRNHFELQHSGFSTVRRSLGAILADELSLTAEPRSMGRSESNWRNYRFSDDGEGRLSRWMRSHLDYAAIWYGGDLVGLEKEVIRLAEPLLNLTHWENPDRRHLMELRRRFRMQSKAKWT